MVLIMNCIRQPDDTYMTQFILWLVAGCSNDVDPDENWEAFGRGEAFCARWMSADWIWQMQVVANINRHGLSSCASSDFSQKHIGKLKKCNNWMWCDSSQENLISISWCSKWFREAIVAQMVDFLHGVLVCKQPLTHPPCFTHSQFLEIYGKKVCKCLFLHISTK